MTSDAEIPGLPDNGEPPPPKKARGPRFAAMVGTTAATRVAGLLLSTAAAVIIARMLGPEGKGTLAFLLTLSSFLHSFGHLGIGSAITYRISRGLTPAPVAASYAVMLALALGLACFGGALLVVVPRYESWGEAALVVIGLSMTPLLFLNNYLGHTLIGQLKIHQGNVVAFVQHLLTLALVGIVVWWLGKGVGGTMGAYVLAEAGAVAMLLFFIWRYTGFRFRWDPAFLKGALGYGVLSYLLLLCNTMVYKVDVFFVKGFLGDTQLGFYSVAVSLAQLFWLVHRSIGLVLIPVVARQTSERSELALRLCRLQMGLSVIAGPLLAAAAPLLILIYGERFWPSLWPLYALLPGILLFPVFGFLTVDLAARGKQRVPLLISLGGVIVDVALVLLLVPRTSWYGGIVGAGLASTVSYSMMALAMSMYFVTRRGARFSEIYIPKRADWESVVSLIHAALPRSKKRPKESL
jgi:O-antigen/teichoic acid export membrane protein